MFIGVQYYRPPFPEKKFWDEDLKKIKETGIDVIQLWACWGWIENSPGNFNFEDYDYLIERAIKLNLKVVISTIAEIQPFWIEREVPDGIMVDHLGRKVKSITRKECIVGLTPGGCTDHPKIRDYMIGFLKEIGKRYGKIDEVIGWDCWNETRWNVHSTGYVCYCPETIKKFRDYLKIKYKSIEGLNEAWKRRYILWDDVLPGTTYGKGCTELIEFLNFLSYRASEIMKFRAQSLREVGVKGIITAHCAAPSILSTGWEWEQPLCRGNDWDFLQYLDGYGCSHFPFWGKFDDRIFGIRVESVRSANQGKILWVSELQGGSARDGLSANLPVEAKAQQRWVWNAFGRGAKGLIFWCWKDEVFGHESGGFGISGNDGMAENRLKELKETSIFLKKYDLLLENYKPVTPSVGILFEPLNYFLEWSFEGKVEKSVESLTGYLKVLEDLNIPYEVVESSHTDILKNLKFLILPFPLVITDKISKIIETFIEKGGIILTEGDMGAFNELAFYRYPGQDRELPYKLGISPVMDRQLIEKEYFNLKIDNKIFKLKSSLWISPLNEKNNKVLAKDEKGRVVAVLSNFGKGTIYAFGTFLGINYGKDKEFDKNFKDFIFYLFKKHNCLPQIKLEKQKEVIYRFGKSGENTLLFVINPAKTKRITFKIPEDLLKNTIIDVRKNREIKLRKKENDEINLELHHYSWDLFIFK
ncbi:MAG TPA: beta-galactosidase [bacterium]|nr:beta-galactosidase [bacterium]HOM25917.1 beta-galactosidase [bacterium]